MFANFFNFFNFTVKFRDWRLAQIGKLSLQNVFYVGDVVPREASHSAAATPNCVFVAAVAAALSLAAVQNVKVRREKSSPQAPLHFMAEGSKDKSHDDYFMTGGERTGYILEDHFVTLFDWWR